MRNYLKETKILDYSHADIQQLIRQRGWKEMSSMAGAKSIYNFVRDDIKFGYNVSDDIAASQVLDDGYGQCNTKATLLMALLRAIGVPNRIHGFTIDKALQKGALRGVWYVLSPQEILHSWAEVYVNGQWCFLEGVILDKPYLKRLQAQNSTCETTFCGFGVYTDNFQNPPIDWESNHTFIQDKGIKQDFGLFDTPDEFYEKHQQQLHFLKRFIFRTVVRHQMNAHVEQIRNPKIGLGHKTNL